MRYSAYMIRILAHLGYSRMVTGSMTEEVRSLEEEIEAVKERIDDPIMCEKIKRYVYAPREIQSVYKADAGEY